jgi:transcriptional regulator GlxA family with amidase domain
MTFSIGFAALPKALSTGITLPCEMLHAAQQIARTRNKQAPKITIHVYSEDGLPAKVTGPIQLVSHGNWHALLKCDWIFIPPLWGNPVTVVRQQQALIDGLKKAALNRQNIISTGTGVSLIAHSGALNNRHATTHWYFVEKFRSLFPKVTLKPGQAITADQNLYCTASVNALTDLVLYFIRKWYGIDIMNVVERHFSHEVKRTITQNEVLSADLQHDDEDIINAQAWILERLAEPFFVSELAAAVGLSERTLSRRFVQATGLSPKQYWQQWRILRAEELLRDSNLNVQEVAEYLGFNDANYFIKQFKKKAYITPNAYRRISRNKQFQLET